MKHILIIGAGLVGAALAYRLAQAGARVTVIEAAHPAAAASGASFGWINASFFHSEAHFNLRAAGIAAHHRLDRDLGQTGTLWQGCLWWEEEGAAFDQMAESLAALGYPVQSLARPEIQSREPALNAPARALFFADEGAVDAAQLTRHLLAASAALLLTGCPARAITTTQGRATGIQTDQGPIAADHILLAAGTACPAFLAPLGLHLPMLPRPGLILRTHPIRPRLNHILASPLQELRQAPDGSLITPLSANHQGDTAEVVTTPPTTLAETALQNLRTLLPGTQITAAQISLAHRPVPGDGLPALGPTGIDGLTLATLHSGVTLAPLVAELLTAEILQGQSSPLLQGFRPTRFFK